MTMIDEEMLRGALSDVADSIQVSEESARAIVNAARDQSHATVLGRLAGPLRSPGHARMVLAAAAGLVVVASISLPLMRSEGGARSTSAAQKLGHRAPFGSIGGKGLVVTNSASSPPYAPTAAQGFVVTSGSVASVSAARTGPRIESSGSVDLHVGGGGVEATFVRLETTVKADGGSVVSSQAQVASRVGGHFANGTIVLQVPQREFATLVAQVQRLGDATSISTTSTDVTSQYVDLRARITAEEASRRQYLAIMARASSIDGILAVQRQLDSIQSQIEQLQGQLNVLDSQTTYGSLTVNVSTAGSVSQTPHHPSGLSTAWHDAIGGFVAGFEWLVRLAGPLLFALLVLGALLVVGRVTRRVIRRRRV